MSSRSRNQHRSRNKNRRDETSGPGFSAFPSTAISALGSLHDLPMVMVLALTPLINSAAAAPTGVGQVLGLQTLLLVAAAVPLAGWVSRRGSRAGVAVASGTLRALATWHAGFAGSLSLTRLAEGATAAGAGAANGALLMDLTPPAARVRAFSAYHAVRHTVIAAGALVGVVIFSSGGSWQSVMFSLGALSIGAVIWSARLLEPADRDWDTPNASPWGMAQTVMRVQTVRRVLGAGVGTGALFLPAWMFVLDHLSVRWEATTITKLGVLATTSTAAAASIAAFAPAGEERFQRDPSSVARWGALMLATGSAIFVVTPAANNLAVFTVGLAAAVGLVGAAGPLMQTLLLSAVSRELRPQAGALFSVAFYAGGGIAGVLLIGVVERRFGTTGALIGLGAGGLVAALLLRQAGNHLAADLKRVENREGELRNLRASRRRPPLLSCRSLDFSYGQVQVLYGVDLEVHEGELVALLGTNGAGKSTLLSLISGLERPSSGTMRWDGVDITSLDAEHRLSIGISQIPGGRAVFGPLTVAENLRVHAYSHGRNRRSAAEAIDRALEAFPRLGERRNHSAATLSGGEQQMLALSKALILEPRLLLIDELSLGLAPIIVEELLDIIKVINTRGTAVVLVEQSVTTALSLSPRAYFMEKGEIRFSGKGSDLLGRKDLLRSVFLEGASAAVGGPQSGRR